VGENMGDRKGRFDRRNNEWIFALPLILTLPMFFRMMYKYSNLVYFRTLNEMNKIISSPNASHCGERIKEEANSHFPFIPPHFVRGACS